MSVNNTHFGSAEISRRLERCNSVFFIGAGGINMSSLALITKNRGLRVGGSDRTKTALTEKLESAGIEMWSTPWQFLPIIPNINMRLKMDFCAFQELTIWDLL